MDYSATNIEEEMWFLCPGTTSNDLNWPTKYGGVYTVLTDNWRKRAVDSIHTLIKDLAPGYLHLEETQVQEEKLTCDREASASCDVVIN